MRVAVSFGKTKLFTGLVFEIHQNAPTLYEAKEIHQILDEKPLINEVQLKHWQWIANYYMCALGDVYRASLPSAFLLESETIVYKNEAFQNEEILEDDEFLIFEALQHQSQLTIHQVVDILGSDKVSGFASALGLGDSDAAEGLSDVLPQHPPHITDTFAVIRQKINRMEYV